MAYLLHILSSGSDTLVPYVSPLRSSPNSITVSLPLHRGAGIHVWRIYKSDDDLVKYYRGKYLEPTSRFSASDETIRLYVLHILQATV